MKNTVFHLSTCSTCSKIIKELKLDQQFELQDIKTAPISEKELDELRELAGSFEDLFSRRAMLFKEMGLKDKQLTESDYKKLILEHYTFLKRPVTVFNNTIFVGNNPKEVTRLKESINK